MQVSFGLDRVVKHDDRAVAGIPLHVAEHLFTRELVAVIAGHDVPHDDAEILLQQFGLPGQHVAVRRTEKPALDKIMGIEYVTHIFLGRCRHALHMVHGVVTHLVSPTPQLLKKIRVASHVIAHAEKGSLYRIIVEYIEHPRRNLRYGPVVERKIDGLLVSRNTPNGLGEEHTVKKRGLLYKHKTGIT